jgi:3-phosphoshikimate 1-carboxyvinyltransferase
MMAEIPVIAIDGPSASGKGTVAALVATRLGWHYLDSGSLYRIVALAAVRSGIDLQAGNELAELAQRLPARFCDGRVLLDGDDVTDAIRSEASSAGASRIAAFPAVRGALLERQRAYRVAPGLVAEGRDMGSVVFPQAGLKLYLTASVESRAQRRYKQLIEKGLAVTLTDLLQDLRERDARDSGRAVAPLQQCADALLLDTTAMSIDQAVDRIVSWATERFAV